MNDESETRRRLAEVEIRAERLTAALNRVQGERDALVLKLTDLEGADSNRFVGVR